MSGKQASNAAQARSIALAGRAIDYRLRHSRRKTLGLRVDHEGLRVAAPLRMPQRQVDAFLNHHRDWVIRALDEWAERPVAPRVVLADGACFPLYALPCRIEVLPGRGRAQWLNAGDRYAVVRLHCVAGQSVFRAVMAAIRQYALTDFEQRVRQAAARLGVTPPTVRLTNARTRWGSCSARAIRLNWRLIHLEDALIDYVVAHEVAHLVHMNHSPAFWQVVESLQPAAQALRRRLRELGRQLPELVDSGSV